MAEDKKPFDWRDWRTELKETSATIKEVGAAFLVIVGICLFVWKYGTPYMLGFVFAPSVVLTFWQLWRYDSTNALRTALFPIFPIGCLVECITFLPWVVIGYFDSTVISRSNTISLFGGLVISLLTSSTLLSIWLVRFYFQYYLYHLVVTKHVEAATGRKIDDVLRQRLSTDGHTGITETLFWWIVYPAALIPIAQQDETGTARKP